MIKCPQCGKDISEQWKFCRFCGYKMTPAEQNPYGTITAEPEIMGTVDLTSDNNRNTQPEIMGTVDLTPDNNRYTQPGIMGTVDLTPDNNRYTQPGSQVPNNNRYTQPGSQVPNNNRYTQPGSQVPNNNRYTQPNIQEPVSSKKKKSKVPIIIAAGIIGCLAIAGTGYLAYSHFSSDSSSAGSQETAESTSSSAGSQETAESTSSSAGSQETAGSTAAGSGSQESAGGTAAGSGSQESAGGTVSEDGSQEAADASVSSDEIVVDCIYRCGSTASDGEGVYFWQYNSGSYESTGYNGVYTATEGHSNTLMYQAADGTLTVILKAPGEGNIAVTNSRIYYSAPIENINLNELYSCNLDGSDVKDLGKGNVCGVTDYGNTLIYASGEAYEENLHSIDAEGTDTLLGDFGFVAVTEDKVIYSSHDEANETAWKQGQITITGADSNGQNAVILCTTAPDLYEGTESGMGGTVTGECIIFNNNLYFSYGAYGGSGGFWQSGKIMKVSLDPLSDSGAAASAEVVSGSEHVGLYFSVNEDGSVNPNIVDVETQQTTGVVTYENTDGTNDFMLFNRKTGDLNAVVYSSEYSSYITKPSGGYLDSMSGVRIGDKCYLLLVASIEDAASSYGWHTGTAWQKMVMLEKNLSDGTVTKVYEVAAASATATADTGNTSASDDATVDPSEYIIPDSNIRILTEADIAGMSSDDIQMAINEIYARHGRKFSTPSVMSYFEGKSWYKGTIDPQTFDANAASYFNDIEDANIKFLANHM